MPITNGDLDGAVQKFWQDIPPGGGMVTKWFLTVEGIAPDGKRSLDFVWTDDLKTWEVRGMLQEAIDSQLTGQLADQILAEPEED
jgi:hypothetical protein